MLINIVERNMNFNQKITSLQEHDFQSILPKNPSIGHLSYCTSTAVAVTMWKTFIGLRGFI